MNLGIRPCYLLKEATVKLFATGISSSLIVVGPINDHSHIIFGLPFGPPRRKSQGTNSY